MPKPQSTVPALPRFFVPGLPAAEGALVRAARLWFRRRPHAAQVLPVIREMLLGAGLPEAAPMPLAAFLGAFAAARQPLRALPIDHDAIGDDERTLLAALTALQHYRHDEAAALLDRWLPIVPLCLALESGGELTRLLWDAGIALNIPPHPHVLAAAE
ncbi:MAG TPA: hypothetical protein VEB64_17840 [Azospirillaceae bacterium]|nr:hypothetical protein [Azospirillaceae bacterium]